MFLGATIDKFLTRVTQIPYHANLFILIPVVIAGVRGILEGCVLHSQHPYSFAVHGIVFYVLLQQTMILALRLSSGLGYREITNIVTVGLVLAWLPPIIDLLLPFQPQRIYSYSWEFHWNFAAPYLLRGETITLWLIIAGCAIVIYWATHKISRAVLSVIASYCVLQFVAWGWFQIAAIAGKLTAIEPFKIMTWLGILLSGALYIGNNPQTMLPSLWRFSHAVPWAAVAMIGSRMSDDAWCITAFKGLTIALAVQLGIFTNDYHDSQADAGEGGQARPVTHDDMLFVTYLQILLVAFFLTFHVVAWQLLMLFFTLTAAYHTPPLRLKRLFCASYKMEGIAAVICFLLGALRLNVTDMEGSMTSGMTDLFAKGNWVNVCAFLFFGGFSLGSMFKDYKDIDQDKADKVGTIYTRYLKKGYSLPAIHAFIVVSNYLMLITPPLLLLMYGSSVWASMTLLLLAPAPSIALWQVSSPKYAVEYAMWALNVYLFVLVFTVPTLH